MSSDLLFHKDGFSALIKLSLSVRHKLRRLGLGSTLILRSRGRLFSRENVKDIGDVQYERAESARKVFGTQRIDE